MKADPVNKEISLFDNLWPYTPKISRKMPCVRRCVLLGRSWALQRGGGAACPLASLELALFALYHHIPRWSDLVWHICLLAQEWQHDSGVYRRGAPCAERIDLLHVGIFRSICIYTSALIFSLFSWFMLYCLPELLLAFWEAFGILYVSVLDEALWALQRKITV